MAIISSYNAVFTDLAAKVMSQRIDSALLDNEFISYFADQIDPPLMTISLDDENDEFDQKVQELHRYIDAMKQDNERIKVAITSGTGGLSSGGMQANYSSTEANVGPRKSVTMQITKVVNGHVVTVGDRTYVCSGDMELSSIVITALADVKLGG